MRKKLTSQMTIFHAMGKTSIAKELKQISHIIDATPAMLDHVYKDLLKTSRPDTGRKGMTAEQVLRSAILKQYRSLTYEELSFHLEDSLAFRAFARLDIEQKPCSSVLQENIKSLSDTTWENINQLTIAYAYSRKLEKGRKIRVDATVVETNIHKPTDSTLLSDGIRIITRLLKHGHRLTPCPEYNFSDHTRVMKKRLITILNSNKEAKKISAYKDMITYARAVCLYGESAIAVLSIYIGTTAQHTLQSRGLSTDIKKAVGLLYRVIDQTERRVLRKEKVPASEKIFSLFEPHSDIIVKRQEAEYGHKIFLTGGSSNLILDCTIERGNPADSKQFMSLLSRQNNIFGRMPRQVSADGGFFSKNNINAAKDSGVKDVSFSKRKGVTVLDMVKSNWVYKQLKNFRAGIEANISALKRSFGLSRCDWTGFEGFKQYVWSSVVSYNLLILARMKLKTS